jgi:hypothetical protein
LIVHSFACCIRKRQILLPLLTISIAKSIWIARFSSPRWTHSAHNRVFYQTKNQYAAKNVEVIFDFNFWDLDFFKLGDLDFFELGDLVNFGDLVEKR